MCVCALVFAMRLSIRCRETHPEHVARARLTLLPLRPLDHLTRLALYQRNVVALEEDLAYGEG